MFTKGNITYADVYKYLRHKTKNIVTLQTKDFSDNYIEEDMKLPISIKVNHKNINFGEWFMIRPKSMSYADIKVALIKMRYSNDDQMALMLNKDDSEEGLMYYNKMQEWREFASNIAKQTNVINL